MAGRSEPTWRVQVRDLLKGSKHLSASWEEPLRMKGAELALEVKCRVCNGTVKLVGQALVPSGTGARATEGITAAARKDLQAHIRRHELCPVKGRKTKGVQQDLGL